MCGAVKLRTAAYCRVSTDSAEQASSLSSQRMFFLEYINKREDMELAGIYYDEGASGTTTRHRKGFNEMIKAAKEGKIDLILTKEVSRFARNTVDTLSITRMLRNCGVGVVFITDNIDTRDSDGELRLSIMATIAQEESRKISERVRWGQKRRMEQGVVFGRELMGYNVSKGKLSIIEAEADIVRRIFTQYALFGKGADTIAAELQRDGVPTKNGGRWSAAYIRRMLKNEKYAGDLVQKKTYTADYLTHKRKVNKNGEKITAVMHHEPIIDRALWEKTQQELLRRSPKDSTRHSDRYSYSGKVFCGICGCVMVSRVKHLTNGGEYHALRCGGRIKGNSCNNETLNVKAMNAVIEKITSIVCNRQRIIDSVCKRAVLSDERQSSDTVKKRIELILKKKSRAVDLMIEEVITKEEFLIQKAAYDRELSNLREQEQLSKKTHDEADIRQSAAEILEAVNDEVWRIIDRAVFGRGTLTVYFDGIEDGFTASFCSKGRGEEYHTIVGEITRAKRGSF